VSAATVVETGSVQFEILVRGQQILRITRSEWVSFGFDFECDLGVEIDVWRTVLHPSSR